MLPESIRLPHQKKQNPTTKHKKNKSHQKKKTQIISPANLFFMSRINQTTSSQKKTTPSHKKNKSYQTKTHQIISPANLFFMSLYQSETAIYSMPQLYQSLHRLFLGKLGGRYTKKKSVAASVARITTPSTPCHNCTSRCTSFFGFLEVGGGTKKKNQLLRPWRESRHYDTNKDICILRTDRLVQFFFFGGLAQITTL